ncbi:MAG: FG-GAP-like repeat-containing protein [Bacteroidota bacterium]
MNRTQIFSLALLLISYVAIGQTTFTESAAAYNLNVGGTKDGGHAWADYDLDGDLDLVINTVGRAYLMRNDGGTFTDVTNTLAPDLLNGSLDRTTLFTDLNNDGYPDIFRNNAFDIRIYLQHPATNTFGNGFGGTTPSQRFTTLEDGLNSEGAGAFDYDGDGDLDLFFENVGRVDILQNNGVGFFTHVTRRADSPNPPYNNLDPTTWPLGLAQDVDGFGDYISSTDFNDDGWVDIVARKESGTDLFTNIGGSFINGVDIDGSNNGNKGSVSFGDFDNDGDFDLYWTEAITNQIHRNNGDGTWTPMGATTGIPTDFIGEMDGLALGDVDNDGDLDIFLSGTGESKLYLNNGTGLSFTDSGLTFLSGGEGCTFVDIDEDGDLDLYMNITGGNALYINNLPIATRQNHLYLNVWEDRDIFGLTGIEQRPAIGANVKIIDCNGNVISGTREVSGGSGHGTQTPGIVHFGLPGGANTPIVVEIGYPNTPSGRTVVRQLVTPSTTNNGSRNVLEIYPNIVDQPPVAQDDAFTTTVNTSITFNPILDNGNGADFDPNGDPLEIASVSQPPAGEGTAVLNPDGTITFNSTGYLGVARFTYTLGNNPTCPFASLLDTATVYISVFPDNDNDGVADIDDLDDDNDGLLDSDENDCADGGVYALAYNHNNPSGTSNDLSPTVGGGSFVANASNESMGAGLTLLPRNVNDGQNFLQLEDANSATLADAITDQDYIEFSFTTNSSAAQGVINTFSINPELNRTPVQENNHKISILLSNNNFTTSTTLISDYIVSNIPGFRFIDVFQQYYLNPSSNYQVRVYFYDVPVTAMGIISHDDIGFQINSCTIIGDQDNDGIPNKLDLDSDNDGIYDLVEAGHNQSGTAGRISGTIGANGLANSVETAPESGAINYTVANTDSTDNDNFLDGDSDNDSCSDANEAYNNPNADGGDNFFFGTGNPPATDSNGLVFAAGYPNPADADANTTADYLEAGATVSITTQPADTQSFSRATTTFTVVASANTDAYQWQIFNGTIWINLANTGIYSGTNTATLTISPVSNTLDGNSYRVNVAQANYTCFQITSVAALLTVNPGSVITNRKITYRVRGN